MRREPTSSSHTPGRRGSPARARSGLAATAVALLCLVWAGALAGCDDTDVGRCCHVLAGRDMSLIPKAEKDQNGEWKNVAATNPAFDCENLTCASYQGSQAYCTKECEFSASCPEGFVCAKVITSSASPTQGPRSYCVRAGVPDGGVAACTP